MRTTLTLLCSSLIALSFSGCATGTCEPKIVEVKVPQKCVIPTVDEPIIDNTQLSPTDYVGITKKAINNYIEMKKYADKLKEAQKVCQ